MNEEMKDVFEWFKVVNGMINSINNTSTDWKEELFVDFVLHKIRGYNFHKLNPLNHLTNLELIKLIDNYKD